MSADFPPEEDAPEQVPKGKIAATLPAKTAQPAGPSSPAALDRVTRRKIAKGRVPIEGKVDLHGLTQREAHGLLLSFLSQARAAGRRHVLVVTGKGSSMGSEGILRRAVPQWFATAAFRGLVSGYEDASRGPWWQRCALCAPAPHQGSRDDAVRGPVCAERMRRALRCEPEGKWPRPIGA